MEQRVKSGSDARVRSLSYERYPLSPAPDTLGALVVLLLTSSLTSLEEAKANASFSVYIPDNSPEVNIPIPNGVTGRVVRVQLEGTGYLSISELHLYELPFLPLSK